MLSTGGIRVCPETDAGLGFSVVAGLNRACPTGTPRFDNLRVSQIPEPAFTLWMPRK